MVCAKTIAMRVYEHTQRQATSNGKMFPLLHNFGIVHHVPNSTDQHTDTNPYKHLYEHKNFLETIAGFKYTLCFRMILICRITKTVQEILTQQVPLSSVHHLTLLRRAFKTKNQHTCFYSLNFIQITSTLSLMAYFCLSR